MKTWLRRVLMLPLLACCMACSAGSAPAAAIDFVRFAQAGDNYTLTFASDTDFFAPSWQEGGRSVVGRSLVCSLGDDADFSVDHAMPRYMRGNVDPLGRAGTPARFTYAATVNFKETRDGGTSDSFIGNADVNRLLAGRTVVPCKMVVILLPGKPYYSKTMPVPVAALLAEIDR